MKKLKVGLFIDTWYPMVDGVIMVVDNYAKRLSKFCDVTVFTVGGGVHSSYKVVGSKRISFGKKNYALPLPGIDRKFKKALKESDLDIVHIHSPFAIGKMGVKYAKKMGIPCVATMHSQYKQDFYKATHSKLLTKFLLKYIMKTFNSCDEYYAVNSKIADVFYDYGAKHLPLVQRNGTDFVDDKEKSYLDEIINQKYGLKSDETVFLFCGRIIKLKNVFFTLKSLKILKDMGQKFKMFYVGDGADSDRLKAKIQEYGMTDEVIMTGKIMDRELVKAFYSRADLFLFPSLYDASSLVQIEASSQKTPTLFIKDAPTSNTITEEVNGYVAELDEQKYAEKILEILSDKEHYKEVCNNAKRDLYVTWDDCVSEMYDKYLYQIEKKKK